MQSFPKTRPWFKRYKICARGENPPFRYFELAREKSWGLDLLQVELTSFLASGAGFLGREAAKRATKDFFESPPGDKRAALQARNRGRGGSGK